MHASKSDFRWSSNTRRNTNEKHSSGTILELQSFGSLTGVTYQPKYSQALGNSKGSEILFLCFRGHFVSALYWGFMFTIYARFGKLEVKKQYCIS